MNIGYFSSLCLCAMLFLSVSVDLQAKEKSVNLQAKENSEYIYNLAIATIFQNDAPYLQEWIEFHRLVGVEHFWLYNNNSEDNYKEVLAPYIAEGFVELIEWSSIYDTWESFSFKTQPKAYRNAINRAKSSKQKTKWLVLLDSDEFLFAVKDSDILTCLERDYADCSGVCVNWQLYGTSGVGKIREDQLMIELLVQKAPEDYPRNLYYKSIVRPERVKNCINPHYCNYLSGYYHVNANRERFEISNRGIFIDKLRINHYWMRDEEFLYKYKVPRYQHWTNNPNVVLEVVDELNQVYDGAILKHAKDLRNRLENRRLSQIQR